MCLGMTFPNDEERRKTIKRIGFAQVRTHRLGLLTQEQTALLIEIDGKAQSYPEIVSLLLSRVTGAGID